MSKNQLSLKLGAASRATLRSKALPGSSFSGLNQAFKMVCLCCSRSAEPGIRLRRRTLFPKKRLPEQGAFCCFGRVRAQLGLTGLEPVTLRLSSACSNQLSYRPKSGFNAITPKPVRQPRRRRGYVWLASRSLGPEAGQGLEARGLEPLTYSLQSYRSTN